MEWHGAHGSIKAARNVHIDFMQWHPIDTAFYCVSQPYKCIALHVLDWQVTMTTTTTSIMSILISLSS